MPNLKIAIIGCGYIGSEIAKMWKKNGHFVTVTTRNPDRVPLLSHVAQKCVILKGNHEQEFLPIIESNDLIVVVVAADSPEHYESAYLNTSQIIRNIANQTNQPKQLIYTSSTAVYGDYQGQWVDETSPLLAKTDLEKILIDAERNYLSLEEVGWQVCLLRLSDIYGGGRELSERVKNYKGKTLAGTGLAYSNMIHQIDCAFGIDYAKRFRLSGVYNLSDDAHPTRKELYDRIAHKFSFPKVEWDPRHLPFFGTNKRVSNHKIKAAGFTFAFPDRILN